jgi:hypothetical protein
MTRLSRVGLVFAGYDMALLVAIAAFYFLSWLRMHQDTSGGMQAFGDSLLIIGLFGILALVPTALAFYFLRSSGMFWTVLSIASLALAATGAVAAVMMGRTLHSSWAVLFQSLSGLLIILGAPLLGFGFLIAALITPIRRSRWILVSAAAIEVTVSAYAFYCLFVLGHWL